MLLLVYQEEKKRESGNGFLDFISSEYDTAVLRRADFPQFRQSR